MKKLLIFVLLFLYSVLSPAQRTPDPLIYKAEQVYRSKQDPGRAIALYKSAFKSPVADLSQVLDAVNCAIDAGDTLSTIQFIQMSIRMGMKLSDYKSFWDQMANGMDLNNLWSKCDVKTNRKIYTEKLNFKIIRSLKKMARLDQKYRSNESVDWARQHELDQANWKALKQMTHQRQRLPRISEIGLDGNNDLEILFYHMGVEEIEWFLPYIIDNIKLGESSLGTAILYQLDRIGMSAGVLYTISDELEIQELGLRTKMKNKYYCQQFGEWFYEKSTIDKKLYFVPIDPYLSLEEVNRVRSLLLMDTIDSRRLRVPWVEVVSIFEFEEKIRS